METESRNGSSSNKPHAVFFPLPLEHHISPMLKLAKLFHRRGFSITFVNAEFVHSRRLLKSRSARGGGLPSLSSAVDFRFETIPDGLPSDCGDTDSDSDLTPQQLYAICQASRNNFLVPFRRLIEKLNDEYGSGNGKCGSAVTCIIGDSEMPFPAVTVAKEIGVPGFLFCVLSACGFMALRHHKHLMERGILPIKDEIADTTVDCIPGLKGIRIKDIPFADRCGYDFPMKETEESFKASGIIFNTFDALERDVLDAITSMLPHVYTLGPFHNLLSSISSSNDDEVGLNSVGSDLLFRGDDRGCLKWLDSMKPMSVVYINFGSFAVMTPQQMAEFAWGIANSDRPFLWIIRPNSVVGGPVKLPPEVLEKVEGGRGMVAAWCPEEEVLHHPSIGGFVTHCGWNSTLESLCAGVPVICWPWQGDEVNCRYSCTHWGIGMEIDNKDVKRDVVEKCVRDLMEGEKGSGVKEKVTEWKKLAVEATTRGGSSFLNFEKLLNQIRGPAKSNMGI